MNNPKTSLATKKSTKPVAKPLTKPTTTTGKTSKKPETQQTSIPKPKEVENKPDNVPIKPKEPLTEQMSFSFNMAEVEKGFQSKMETQRKANTKLKMELQSVKDENVKLKLSLEEKEKLLKELQTKFSSDNEGFLAKRSFLLKSKILKQEKHIIMLESQIRSMKGLYIEIHVQLENSIELLEKVRSEDLGKLKDSGRLEDFVESLRVCQGRLPQLRASGRYEYGQKIHKDNIATLEYEENDEEEEKKIVEQSGIKSRTDLEESLIGIIEMVESLKEQLGGEKNTNTLVNLGHLSRKVAEFMIEEGLDVRKVRKIFGKKENNAFIQKNVSYFEFLLQNLRENGEILRRFNRSTENMAQEMVSVKGKENVSSYIQGFMNSLDEDKKIKIMKNKDMSSFIDNITEVSKIEKYMHDSQRAILSLFAAKAFGEIENLREFVEGRIMQITHMIENEVYKPYRDMYTIYKNYEGMGNDIKVGVNVLGVLNMAGDRMMQALERALGIKSEFQQKQDPQSLSLKMVIDMFEKKVKTSLEGLAS